MPEPTTTSKTQATESSTALERALASPNGPRATPLDALSAARKMFLADGRIDMGALARDLGIGRATLYNWVGSKERLLAEMFWSFADAAITDARQTMKGSGVDYLAGVIERYLSGLAGYQPVREFIARDPEYALRVLASRHTPFQRRLIETVRDMIVEQVEAGAYEPPLDPESLALVLVRIGESFIYADVITGSEPDLDKAVQAQRVLLHAPPLDSKPGRRAA